MAMGEARSIELQFEQFAVVVTASDAACPNTQPC